MYIIDVKKYVQQFQNMMNDAEPSKNMDSVNTLNVIQDPFFRRLASTIDMELALPLFNVYRCDSIKAVVRNLFHSYLKVIIGNQM